MKLTRISHHAAEDDHDCLGDYCEISLSADGKEIIRYGSQYDAKGYERIEGFVDGIVWALKLKTRPKIKDRAMADWNY